MAWRRKQKRARRRGGDPVGGPWPMRLAYVVVLWLVVYAILAPRPWLVVSEVWFGGPRFGTPRPAWETPGGDGAVLCAILGALPVALVVLRKITPAWLFLSAAPLAAAGTLHLVNLLLLSDEEARRTVLQLTGRTWATEPAWTWGTVALFAAAAVALVSAVLARKPRPEPVAEDVDVVFD